MYCLLHCVAGTMWKWYLDLVMSIPSAHSSRYMNCRISVKSCEWLSWDIAGTYLTLPYITCGSMVYSCIDVMGHRRYSSYLNFTLFMYWCHGTSQVLNHLTCLHHRYSSYLTLPAEACCADNHIFVQFSAMKFCNFELKQITQKLQASTIHPVSVFILRHMTFLSVEFFPV